MRPRERALIEEGKPGAYHFMQGSDAPVARMATDMMAAYGETYELCEDMLKAGIAREVACMVLPVCIYTSFYATCNTPDQGIDEQVPELRSAGD